MCARSSNSIAGVPATAPNITTARLIAIVTGIIGAVLAIATPLLPVQQDVSTLSWPQRLVR